MFNLMDNIGDNNTHHKAIAGWSVAGFLFLVEVASVFIYKEGSIFEFFGVESDAYQEVLSIIIPMVIFGIIYFFISLVFNVVWIRQHPKMWVKGKWLHIHMKDKIRIGTVDIKQNFATISAIGRNISPQIGDTKLNASTNWSYMLAKVADDESARDLIGCYEANENISGITKSGVHTMQFITYDSKTGYPVEMEGRFSDTFDIKSDDITNSDGHKGQIFWYRLNSKCRKYLEDNGNFDYEKLAVMHMQEEFQDEPFVKKLKECIEENQQKHSK